MKIDNIIAFNIADNLISVIYYLELFEQENSVEIV